MFFAGFLCLFEYWYITPDVDINIRIKALTTLSVTNNIDFQVLIQ